MLLLVYRHLYDRKPFLGILLVPHTIDVDRAVLTHDVVALLLDIAEKLSERLIETLIRAIMCHTQSTRNLRQPLKLNNGTVLPHFFHLLTIFDIDISGRILLVVFYREAIARHGATTTQSVHLRTDYIDAQWAEILPTFNYLAVRGYDN